MNAGQHHDVRALQALVAVEDSMIYGVESVGGMAAAAGAGAPVLTLLHAVSQAHRAARDSLTARLLGQHELVPAAAPGYAVPSLSGVAAALAFAAGLEDRCTADYRAAAALFSAAPLRGLAVAAVIGGAERTYLLRTAAGTAAPAAMQAFPGS